MKDITPVDAPRAYRPSEMRELIDELASYNNEGSALGYSVFYYASYMYQQPGLKMIAVDGVEPSDETIADGSYPLLNEFYVAIRAERVRGVIRQYFARGLENYFAFVYVLVNIVDSDAALCFTSSNL